MESVTAPVADLLPVLRRTHDARFPLSGESTSFEEGCKAALASREGAGGAPVTLSLDLHAFVTSVVPSAKPKAA